MLFHQCESFVAVECDMWTEQKLIFFDAFGKRQLHAQIKIHVLLHDSSGLALCQRCFFTAETTDQTVFDRAQLIDSLKRIFASACGQYTAVGVEAVLLRILIKD